MQRREVLHPSIAPVTIAVRQIFGPRGPVGQRAIADIPEWPGSFDSSHSTFASLESAVNAAGTGRKFRITSSFAFTGVIQPHTSDEFWFDPGVTITRSGAISNAIKPASAVSGVKVMNGKFSGFNAGTGSGNGNNTDKVIDANGGSTWEIAYCEFTSTYYGAAFGIGSGTVVHHNLFNAIGGAIDAFKANYSTVRDNEFSACGDSTSSGGHKFVGTRGTTFEHNYCHGCPRGGVWFDTGNSLALVQWNIIENTGSASPMGGVAIEANRWVEGSVTGPDVGTKILVSNGNYNTVCWNLFVNNQDVALHILHSSGTRVFRNTFIQDVAAQPNLGSIALELDGALTVIMSGHTMSLDLEQNQIRENEVMQTQSSRKAASLSLSNVGDTSPYYTNTKDNSLDFNTYDLIDAATAAFAWNGNKTFAQWQAIPQDVNGSMS